MVKLSTELFLLEDNTVRVPEQPLQSLYNSCLFIALSHEWLPHWPSLREQLQTDPM